MDERERYLYQGLHVAQANGRAAIAQASHPAITATEAREGLALRLRDLDEQITSSQAAFESLQKNFRKLEDERRMVQAALDVLTPEKAQGPA